MSSTENVDKQVLNEKSGSALDSLFKERDTVKAEGPIKKDEELKVDKKEVKEPKLDDDKESSKNTLKSKTSEIENKVHEKKEDLDEDEVKGVEVEKLKKALNDSQKWGHSNNKRLKSVTKMISSLKEDGAITEDEFTKLNDLLRSDAPEPEIEILEESKDPFVNLIQKANTRISDLEDISDDPLFKNKAAAFLELLKNSSDDEKEDILDQLEEFKDNPLKLAKKMYGMAENFYNEFYKDLDASGGIKGFVSQKNSEIQRLQKKIDKLERKLLEYNDYDKPTSRIDELVDSEVAGVTTNKPKDTLDQLFKERDHIKRV
jgi:DNA repair exonuclease SbcCD ATPase subunit